MDILSIIALFITIAALSDAQIRAAFMRHVRFLVTGDARLRVQSPPAQAPDLERAPAPKTAPESELEPKPAPAPAPEPEPDIAPAPALLALARLAAAGKISPAVAVEIGLGVKRGGGSKTYQTLRARIEELARDIARGGRDPILTLDPRGRVVRVDARGRAYVVDPATRARVDVSASSEKEAQS